MTSYRNTPTSPKSASKQADPLLSDGAVRDVLFEGARIVGACSDAEGSVWAITDTPADGFGERFTAWAPRGSVAYGRYGILAVSADSFSRACAMVMEGI